MLVCYVIIYISLYVCLLYIFPTMLFLLFLGSHKSGDFGVYVEAVENCSS